MLLNQLPTICSDYKESGSWPAPEIMKCSAFTGPEPKIQTDLNLLQYLKEANPSKRYGNIVLSGNGKSTMDFDVKITKQQMRGGETIKTEDLGTWETVGNLRVKAGALSQNFSGVTIHKVVIVVVRNYI